MSEQTTESEALDEALAEMGRQARADEACSICHASVRPDRRDRHLDWHASLSRSMDRERLPEVFGSRVTPAEVGRCGDEAPPLSGVSAVHCRLPHGHPGWHRGDDDSEWKWNERPPGEASPPT